MTHGEEPGPETHTDSAVLTYLEGLLMHPVAAGPGATATRRSEAPHGHGNQMEQVNKAARPFQLPSHSPAIAAVQKAGNGNSPTLHHGASQNLKKARLLRSGPWNEPGAQRLSSPPVELNGQGGGGGGLQNGALEGSPHAGESTLLASLLQSFSSRLQSVAMSQQSTKPPSEHSPPTDPPPPADKEQLPCYGMASSRLKGLMRKTKLQNHSSTPYSRRGHSRGHSQERSCESPRSVQSSTPPSAPTVAAAATDAVSCAERLKAVANLVKIRSSPAPSPKPSVACSQLALLLSSEAHLQQYSREQALKAQLSGRSASERLAAMATQQTQDKRPPSTEDAPPTSATTTTLDVLSSLTSQNGTTTATLPQLALNSSSSQQSPSSLLPVHSSPHPTPPPLSLTPNTQTQPQTPTREKRGFDSRATRPPQTCSSLLLLLLNNHNNQKQLTKNGHLEDDCGVLPASRGSSVTSDSECSVQEKSLAKREESCSDAEISFSSCSPIDLSMRSRANTRAPETRPKATSSSTSASYSSSTAFSSNCSSAVFSSAPTVFSSSTTAFSSSSTVHSSSSTTFCSSSSSSLDKLTESLLNKWKPDPSGPKVTQVKKELEMSPDLKSQPKVTLMQLLLERRNNDKVNKIVVNPDLQHDATLSSLSRVPLKSLAPWEEVRIQSPLDRPSPALPMYSLSRDPSSTPSPFSYPSPYVQSSPLDLCKSKPFPVEKAATEPAFSASKLLQNLAQCGTASPSPPMVPSKVPSQDLEMGGGRPLALLERLNAPIQRNTTCTPLSNGPSGSGTPSFSRWGEVSPPASQIENLLERRTVLQLLLGAGSSSTSSVASATHRDWSGGRGSVETAAGGCYEKPPGTSVICDNSNGPTAADVKVKTEPGEEGLDLLSSAVCEDVTSQKRRGGGAGYNYRHNPFSEPQQDLKTEPRPTEVIAKYGLLSQLLKQQSATYYTSAAQLQTDHRPSPVHVKEEQRDYHHQGPSPVHVQEEQRDYHHQGPSPKKIRLCTELAESLNNGSPQRAVVDSGGSYSYSSLVHSLVHKQIQEEPDYHKALRGPKVEETPARSPSSEALLPRESRGFNVLKQLLLSDNCLKELSQHPRGGPSPSVLQANGKANGSVLNLNQPGYNHHNLLNLPTLPWHHPNPHNSLSSGPPTHLRPQPTTPPTGDSSQRSPWGRHTALPPHQDSPKRDPTPVKREPESPGRWAGRDREEEGSDSSPDSPRLTRSNPILYYMLQKGSAQLRREGRDQAEGTQGSVPGGVRVKEEPGTNSNDAYNHRLSSTTTSTQHSSLSPPYNNDKHSHKNYRLSDSSDKW